MYLKRFKIERIKCFDWIQLDFPHDGNDFGGWIVLLGGNGAGKSTLLQAMALTLVGLSPANVCFSRWAGFRRDSRMGP
jgi:ABC-type sulfate/molybdate transport systems ATPase subunit